MLVQEPENTTDRALPSTYWTIEDLLVILRLLSPINCHANANFPTLCNTKKNSNAIVITTDQWHKLWLTRLVKNKLIITCFKIEIHAKSVKNIDPNWICSEELSSGGHCPPLVLKRPWTSVNMATLIKTSTTVPSWSKMK